MFSENLMTHRKNKGITQEELAIRLNVVRQTVSKWEKGQSVPDADLLIKMADIFDVSVSELLGTKIVNEKEIGDIAQQLSRINEQLAIINRRARRIWKTIAIVAGAIVVLTLFVLLIFTPVFNTEQPVTMLKEEVLDYIQETTPPIQRVRMPDFRNKRLLDLLSDPRYIDIFDFLIIEEYNNDIPEGYIISQNPSAGSDQPLIPIGDFVPNGTNVNKYEKITIETVVSKGPEPSIVDIPNPFHIIHDSDIDVEIVVKVGDSFTLDVLIDPESESESEVRWLKDSSVVEIVPTEISSRVIINALEVGTTTITIVKDNETAKRIITVLE